MVDYRTDRLRIRNKTMTVDESTGIYHVKKHFDGLHPTLGELDRRRPIGLLSWLTTWRNTFDMLEISEASAVRVVAYFLGAEAKEVHAEQFGMVELELEADHSTVLEHRSWPHVVQALIRRFLSDDVLHEAHGAVARVEQKPGEDERELADRISKASRRISHVFTKRKLINSLAQGLRPAVRELVGQQVRTMTEEDRVSLSAARKVVCAFGRSQRAIMKEGRG